MLQECRVTAEKAEAARKLADDAAAFMERAAKQAARSVVRLAQEGGLEDPLSIILGVLLFLQGLNGGARVVWGLVPALRRRGAYPLDR